MNFRDSTESEKLRANLERRLVETPRPIFCYESHIDNDYASAARAFVASLAGFQDATLLYFFSVPGDGWNEHLLTNQHWTRFRHWREGCGEARRLYEAPGQVFSADESGALVEAIAFALQLGWDAWLAANRGNKLIVFSHDDRVEIHRGCVRANLQRDLLRLGCWSVAAHS
jgi:hypothetical protein